MQMKKHNKILSYIFVVFFLSSLTVRSETAPNLLDLTEGTVIIGDIYLSETYGQFNFSVDRIFYDSFFDEDFVELSRAMNHTPPYDPTFKVKNEIATSLVVKDNRTVYLNLASYYIETVDYNITVFVDYTDDLNMTEDDLKVTYNGTTYTYNTIDPGEPFYDLVSFWTMNWALANLFDKQMMPLLKYAISPQATIGQEILYGQYNGTVVGFTEYYISETEYFEAIEVHHDETIVIINIFGSDQPYTFGDTTLLYEKNTGIILHWLEYNSSAGYYYYYNATDVIGLVPIIVVPEFSVPFIAVISSILIAIPILIARRKRKL
ncbi:MAG: hypothetical protein KGD64_12770 [Candidatus Heimdallarchaeota archaeon]|nr:hypothetical protein [Candidatus Heimdallarchaeota archaeon]